MAGHAGDVIATKEQIATARNAIMLQLSDSGIAKDFDSLADALDKLDMWGFIENQARVVAQLHAFSVRDNAIIHKMTFERSQEIDHMSVGVFGEAATVAGIHLKDKVK